MDGRFAKNFPSTGSGNEFFRTCQTVQSHGGRLGSAEIFSGQAQGTSFFVLAKQYRAMEGGFAHAESRSDSAILRKIHGGIFLRRPTRDWRGGGSRSVGMEGVGAPGTPESP